MKAVITRKLYPVSGEPIDNGTVLIDDNGKIAAFGTDIDIPADAEIIRMDDSFAVPGLIDPHSYIALTSDPHGMNEHYENDEVTGPFNPHICSLDGFYPDDLAIVKARKAGYTTVFTATGSDSVISGRGAAFKTKKSNNACDMVIPESERLVMTVGQQPIKAGKGGNPSSHMGIFSALEEFLEKCRIYRDSSDRNFDKLLDAMLPVMNGESAVLVSVFKARDMLRLMKLFEKYGIRYVFVHADECYLIRDEIIDEKVPVIYSAIFSYPFRSEQWNVRSDTPVVMSENGLETFSFSCYETSEIEFHRAWNGRYRALGMSDGTLLRAMTLGAAEILGLDRKIGSIEVGKDADIAFFNGDPLSNLSICTGVMIDGEMYEGQEMVK